MNLNYNRYINQKKALYKRLNLTLSETINNIPKKEKKNIIQLHDIDYTTLLSKNLNINDIRDEYSIKKRISIKDIFDSSFAILFYKTIIKIPSSAWNIVCGVENTKYEKPLTKKNKKSNEDNARKARKTFGEDSFSYVFYRTMCDEKIRFLPEKTMRNLLMSPYFMDLIYKITNIKVTQLNQVFLSKYKSGNFLAPHSDINNGKIAFVFNFSVNWKPQYGGILHFLSEDRTNIIDSYVPMFNSMMIFEIPKDGIPHFVSHIAPNVKRSRYALTGWYS